MTHGSGLSNVLSVLKDHGANVRSHGGYYTAECPAHEDQRASLSISQGEKGAILKCHAGCEVDDIRSELKLSWPDLFDNGGQIDQADRRHAADLWMPCQVPVDKGGKGCGGHKSAEYRYTNEKGVLLYAVARCSRKGDGCPQPFAQWHPDSTRKHGKRWGLPGEIRRVLYNLPAVLEAAKNGKRIWLMEGEKDADRMMADFPGEVATTVPSGAGRGKWRLEYTRCFAGASEVIIVADCDETGLTHAEEVHHHVGKIVDKVKVVCTPLMEIGSDFTDHRNYGYGLDEFQIVPFELVERRPVMAIQIEERHKEEGDLFRGMHQSALERSLVGSILKYGLYYDINEVDIRSDDQLRSAAAAIARIVAQGSAITPETVAVEVEKLGRGKYQETLDFLLTLEKVAFSDKEKPKRAASLVLTRSVRLGIRFSLNALREAVIDERRPVEELLTQMSTLAERHSEEHAAVSRQYAKAVGDAFTADVVAEIANETTAAETTSTTGNVRNLEPLVAQQRNTVARIG